MMYSNTKVICIVLTIHCITEGQMKTEGLIKVTQELMQHRKQYFFKEICFCLQVNKTHTKSAEWSLRTRGVYSNQMNWLCLKLEQNIATRLTWCFFVCFLRVSQDDVLDSYCADRQLQICLASWLVGGWVLSLGVSCHIKARQWKKEKALCLFCLFEVVVHQKEQFSLGPVIHIWTWKLYFVKQKKSSCPWQIKKTFSLSTWTFNLDVVYLF